MTRWRVIPGASRYEASDDGRVRHIGGREKKATMGTRGRLQVGLVMDDKPGQIKSLYVHQAVMLAFVGPRPDGLCVRHLNGVAIDNRLVNLAYGTYAENNQDTVKHGRHRLANKTHCANGHEYNDVNTRIEYGPTGRPRRVCRVCNKERLQRLRDRQKAERSV